MAITRCVQVRVDQELFDWFDEYFPYATKQEYLLQCLLHLRAAVESGALPLPNVYPARSAIQAVRTILER